MNARRTSVSLQTGLTLIELLVSLVILGFVVTIMSGAFFQIAQVVRVAENVNGEFQPQWVRLNALTDLVANLALPADNLQPFVGNSTGFEGHSLSLPQDDWGNAQAFTVKLVRTKQNSELTVATSEGKTILIAAWSEPVELEYLSTDGSTHSIWPPFGRAVDLMPSGVVVRATSGGRLIQLVAPYAGLRNPEPNAIRAAEKFFGVPLS